MSDVKWKFWVEKRVYTLKVKQWQGEICCNSKVRSAVHQSDTGFSECINFWVKDLDYLIDIGDKVVWNNMWIKSKVPIVSFRVFRIFQVGLDDWRIYCNQGYMFMFAGCIFS